MPAEETNRVPADGASNAIPSCPWCEQRRFGLYLQTVRHAKRPVALICCENCGAAISALDAQAAQETDALTEALTESLLELRSVNATLQAALRQLPSAGQPGSVPATESGSGSPAALGAQA